MRRLVGVSAVAVGLALTGCENSVDPPAEDTSAAAQEDTAAGQEDATGDAGTGTESTDTDTGATDTGATGTTGTDAGAADGAATDTGTDMSATDGSITDEAMTRLQERFPMLASVVPQDQMRSVVGDVCGAVGSGDVASAQQELQQRFGLDTSMAEQVVSFLEQDVCSA